MGEFSDKVLMVDDDANLLAGMRRLLGQKFTIVTAEGGIEALGKAQNEGPFAVVVCDMRMPGMDGIEVLRRLQEAAPDTVRIMLTGNADQNTAVEAINGGRIFRFLNKPCSMAALAEAMDFVKGETVEWTVVSTQCLQMNRSTRKPPGRRTTSHRK